MARIRCPRIMCRSHDCTPISTKKGYKTGKGLLGGTIGAVAMAAVSAPLAPVGAIAGAASGLNGKKTVTMMCNKCGNVFKVKL